MKQIPWVGAPVAGVLSRSGWIAGCAVIAACSSGSSDAVTNSSSAAPSAMDPAPGDPSSGVPTGMTPQPHSSVTGNPEGMAPSPGTSGSPSTFAPGSNGPVVTEPVGGAGNVPSNTAPNNSAAPTGETNGGGPNGSAVPSANGGAENGAAGSETVPTGMPGGNAGEGGGNGGSSDGAAGAGGTLTGGTPVERHGRLQVSGNRLHGAHDRPVTLRGQGLGWDNWWPQYYNADVVAWLREDWCVDIVRPAMGIEPDGAYLQSPDASRARIQTVVDAAIAAGTYVIIDWHAHNMYQSEAIAFFSAMAQAYGASPNVIYEVYNEPEEETWPQVKAYAEAVIAAIREHDPDNLVIVGSPEWDQRIDLVAADPISSDNNVIYAVHFYAGAHGQWLRDRTAEALASGVPVLVSESGGSEASGMGTNNYAEWEAWFSFMDQNQISWINYSVSDKAGETISALEPGASASGGWDAAQLTETGEYIRNVFREHCDY